MNETAPPSAPPVHRHRWLRRVSWVLMGVAVLLTGYVGTLIGYQSYQQHRLQGDWAHDHPAAGITDATFSAAGAFPIVRPHLADGQAVARLTIPKIGFEAVVTEGADSGILSGGPGHDDRTGYPGEGRLVLIGNHNGFSMSWGDLQAGDEVVVEMPYGRYHYRIAKRLIVDGSDTSVINQAPHGEELVLSTCWPLWAGAFAHQRLVFEAAPAGKVA